MTVSFLTILCFLILALIPNDKWNSSQRLLITLTSLAYLFVFSLTNGFMFFAGLAHGMFLLTSWANITIIEEEINTKYANE
jgi:hypothetical protein